MDPGNFVHGAVEVKSSLENEFRYLEQFRTNTVIAGFLILIAIGVVITAISHLSTRFVPDQFLRALGKRDITDVRLGDAVVRDMTVFFLDIRRFTTTSGNMSADENLTFLNALLRSALPAIERHNGFVDKYVGDAIME